MDRFGYQVSVDKVKSGVGLGLYGPLYRALDPNPKIQYIFSCKKTKLKSTSLQALIGLVEFVVRKLWS